VAFIRKHSRNGRIYLAEVKNQRVDGKVVQKFIRYVGVDPDSDRAAFPTCNQELSLDGVKLHGSILALNSAAELLNLRDILGEHYAPILALVFCHCHDYRGVKDMTRWLSKVNFYDILKVDKITEKQLHQAISEIENMDLLSIEKSIFEKMKSKFNDSCHGVVYDVTNTYLRGSLSELAQKGKDKEGVHGRRLIQIGLGLTDEKQLPIFYQVHPGNIHDSKIFKEAIEYFSRLNIKTGNIVYDRGLHASSSILRLADTNWKIIGGVPFHKGIKEYISNLDLKNLESLRNRHQQGDSVFYAKSFPFNFGQVEGRLILLLNPEKKNFLKEKRLKELLDLKKSSKEVPLNIKKYFNKNGKINSHAIRRQEQWDGLSAIFVTGKISIQSAINCYFGKDLIERAFMSLKSVLGLRPIRHWLDGKIKGHLFVCYLSLVLQTTLRCQMDKSGSQSLKEITPTRAIKELESVYIIEYSKKKGVGKSSESPETRYQKVVTLTKLQETILSAIVPNLNL
jgi:transposase